MFSRLFAIFLAAFVLGGVDKTAPPRPATCRGCDPALAAGGDKIASGPAAVMHDASKGYVATPLVAISMRASFSPSPQRANSSAAFIRPVSFKSKYVYSSQCSGLSPPDSTA